MKRFKKLIIIIIVVFMIILIKFQTIEQFSFISKPHIDDKDTVYVKTLDGKYITSCDSCFPIDANIDNRCSKTLCLKDEPYITSQFIYHTHRDGTFSLETADGKYWKRCAECISLCPHVICADGINPNLQTHKFVLIKNNDNQNSISIKTDNGRLLEVSDCNQTCGKIITALGLNSSSNFIAEKVISPVVAVQKKQPLKMVSFENILPKPFPQQWPYSQH